MVKMIADGIKNIPVPCAALLKYGMIFCVLLILTATAALVYNLTSGVFSQSLDALCKTAAVTAVYVFAEVISGAVFIGLLRKKALERL